MLIFADNVDEPGICAAAATAPANCSRHLTKLFVCDDEAVIVPVRLFADMLNEESNSNDGGHAANSGGGRTDDARAAELQAPTIYGRAENWRMRLIILKVAAADEMEEQRASAVAAADASSAGRPALQPQQLKKLRQPRQRRPRGSRAAATKKRKRAPASKRAGTIKNAPPMAPASTKA